MFSVDYRGDCASKGFGYSTLSTQLRYVPNVKLLGIHLDGADLAARQTSQQDAPVARPHPNAPVAPNVAEKQSTVLVYQLLIARAQH